MGNFKLPPISTLSGTTLTNFIRILSTEKIASKYYFKLFLSFLIILIATPFHIWEKVYFYRQLKTFIYDKEPLFILGHWRSGTTFLHNILSKSPSSSYMTTYHSVFPNNLGSKWLFKTLMRINMPDKRPSDNVELNIDYPQEDEFAFCNINPYSYYKFFYFPNEYRKIYKQSVYHEQLSEKEIKRWYSDYERLLKKALIDKPGERLIVKNPVNTARIKMILKLYPNAKFLYIYRNPVTVYLSTERFFKSLFPTLQLQHLSEEFIETMVFDTYKRLMDDYLSQKSYIPKGNLYELRFEDFENQAMPELRKISNELLAEDFESKEKYFSDYLKSQRTYKKNRYKIEKSKIDLILKNFSKYMELYNYDIPSDIDVCS